MDQIKKHCFFKTICVALITTFIFLDISYAYPAEHNAGNSTLATPSLLQQTPINGQLSQSLLFRSALVTLVCDIGEYSFGNNEKEGRKPLPSKYSDDAMRADLGKHLSDAGIEILNIVPVEYIKNSVPEKLKAALEEMEFKAIMPDKGVVFILCKRGDKKFLLLVSKKDQVSSDSLPGYEWKVSDKYVVKYIPEDYESPQSEIPGLPKNQESAAQIALSPATPTPVRFMLIYLSEARDDTKIHEPLSITTLGGALKTEFADEVKLSLVHPLAEGGIPGVIERIRHDKPNILGLSLSFDTLGKLDEIMNFVNSLPSEERPMILLGNILAKHNVQILLKKYPDVIICVGEGEYTVKDAVRYYRKEIAKKDMRNVRYLDENGDTVINPYERVDFAQIGLPVRDLLPAVIQSGGIAHFETSRGCPHDCTMCSRKSFLDCDGKTSAGWQGRSVEEAVRDLANLSRYGVRFINVVDEDLFGGGIERVEAIADGIIEAKRKGAIAKELEFFTSSSVRGIYDANDTLENNKRKERVLGKLKEAGMTNFFMGIESGSPTQLKRYGKSATVSENEEALKVVKRVGIRCVPGFIMFDPEVTKQELLENMAFLRRTGTDRTITHALKTYFPMAGSMLAIDLMNKGLVDPAAYKPDFSYYEYVYANRDVAHIHEWIRVLEESLSRLSWSLKLIFRSSGSSQLPKKEQGVLISMMEEQALILVDYLEDLLKASTEEEYPEIERKYQDRLLTDMILLLKISKHGQLHIDGEFQPNLYKGMAREVIRTNFYDREFSANDITRYIANRFAYGLNADILKETLNIFEKEGRVRRITEGSYVLVEDFWLYRNLPFYDPPRQARSETDLFEPLRSVSQRCRPKVAAVVVPATDKAKPSPVFIFDFDGTIIKKNENVFNAASKVYHWIKTGRDGNVPLEAIADLKSYLANRPWKYVGDHILDWIQDLDPVSRKNIGRTGRLLLQRYIPQYQIVGDAENDWAKCFMLIFEVVLKEEYSHSRPELLPGAAVFLERLRQEGSPAFIVSGMPQTIIEEITLQLGIKQYFTAIHGSSSEQILGHGKESVFQEIMSNFGVSTTTPAIFIGDSPSDMEAAKLWAKTSGRRCAAVGVAESFDKPSILFEHGADFVLNRGYDWNIFSYLLTADQDAQQGALAYSITGANVEDILSSVAPIVFLSAEKEDRMLPSLRVDSQPLVFDPFVSPVLEKIQAANYPTGPPEISSLENISQVYGLARKALETDQIEIFSRILEMIARTPLLEAAERCALVFAVFSWNKVLPFTQKREKFFPYSFQSFSRILKQHWDSRSKEGSLKIAQFGSGDGLMPLLDRMLAEAIGIKSEFTFFEISAEKVAKSLKYNPQCSHVQCDLRFLINEYQKTFDVIYLNNVLHEIFAMYGAEGVIAVLSLAYRYLKDGGRIVLRDGISGDNKQDLVIVQSRTRQGEESIETFSRLASYAGIFGTDHYQRHVMRYFDVGQILTKTRFSFEKDERYPIEEEYRQVYNFATWEEYVRWFQQAGLSIQTAFFGIEQLQLALWQELFYITNPITASKKAGDDVSMSEAQAQFAAPQPHKTTQLFEIVESSLNNERVKFINSGNRLINSLPITTASEPASNIGVLDKDMATAEIRQRIEKAIAAIGSLNKESITPEAKTAIELLNKNFNQFEADGAVGSLIILARKAKRENQKLIIGLETDWIPGINVQNSLQRQAINALMKEIYGIGEAIKSMGLDNVEIIRVNGNELANSLLTEADKSHTNMHNIVVMASTNTINSDSFAQLRNADENDRPFLTGIDSTELIKLYTEFGESVSKQLYIRLTSLLYITLELAAGKEPPQSPIIVSYDKKMRILILLPKADPIDYEVLKSNYTAEKIALEAA